MHPCLPWPSHLRGQGHEREPHSDCGEAQRLKQQSVWRAELHSWATVCLHIKGRPNGWPPQSSQTGPGVTPGRASGARPGRNV